jgi:amino acid transporter
VKQIREDRAPQGTMGTFAGVFTPSIVTILGIILFLRLGYVVGTAGLGRALLIILLANAISVLTSVSLSAIATNLHVKGGGDYYLISRTLGVAYGGALGVVLFLAQSVSIVFYAIGFGEAVAPMVGADLGLHAQGIAVVAVFGVFVLAWLGADWATRFQYAVMLVLFAAILAFFVGGALMWNTERLFSNVAPSSDLPFWVIFAIFFPAVTGFTQGVSMSGDLKDPDRSLPLGTFAAVGLSGAIYVAMAVVFAAVLPGEVLVSDYGVMQRVSPFPWLVGAGVIAATLSSALAFFLGAPRILQSLAADRVFPFLHFFAKGHGPNNNPRRGVVLSLGIACGTVALGNLNVVAAVVSMFFLISYGLLNYATYFEARAKSPSFRPRFRFFNERLSLAGCLGCLGAMIAINPAAGAVAVAVLFGLHRYVSRTSRVERWADSDRSRRLQRIREDLHAISSDPDHPRYWRPVVLAFSDDPERRARILRFAS